MKVTTAALDRIYLMRSPVTENRLPIGIRRSSVVFFIVLTSILSVSEKALHIEIQIWEQEDNTLGSY